jgi:hypothetical protein
MQKQTQQKPFSYIEGVAISNQNDRHGTALCVGDTVRIDAIVADQVEYDNSWVSDMNKFVGSTGKILYIGNTGIQVDGTDAWNFPSTSLVLIRQVEEDNQVEQTKAEPKPLRAVPHNQIILEWLTNPELILEFKADCSKEWQVLTPNGQVPGFYDDYEYRLVKPKKFEKVYKYAFQNSKGGNNVSIGHFAEEEWKEFSNRYKITEFTRLDWTVKEVEVK